MGPGDRGHRTFWLTLFAVAMGLLEAAVVVYLRLLYYPEGFRFPVVELPPDVAAVEVVREATTLLMMLSLAVLAGRRGIDRFFVFGYLFGVWDICYYLGLKLFLGWPESWFTWDILFLIPLPWLGPVLYPLLVSVFLIAGYLVHEVLGRSGRSMALTGPEWAVACSGGLLVVVSFCWHWRVVLEGTMPPGFPWWMFLIGLVAGTAPFVRAAQRAMYDPAPSAATWA